MTIRVVCPRGDSLGLRHPNQFSREGCNLRATRTRNRNTSAGLFSSLTPPVPFGLQPQPAETIILREFAGDTTAEHITRRSHRSNCGAFSLSKRDPHTSDAGASGASLGEPKPARSSSWLGSSPEPLEA